MLKHTMDPESRAAANAAMVRLADGERSAFDVVYATLQPAVDAFCRRVLSPADAADATQLALMTVFSQASDYERSKDVLSWALTVAAWEVKTIRRRQTRSRTESIDGGVFRSGDPSPEEQADERAFLLAAERVLGQLSDADRQAIILTIHQESPDGVAGATFRKRRERALQSVLATLIIHPSRHPPVVMMKPIQYRKRDDLSSADRACCPVSFGPA